MLSHDKLIADYWKEVKEHYPDLDYSKFERICKAPWNFIKMRMKDENLPIILIKYLGKIKVFPGKIRSILKELEYSHRNNFITEDYYQKRKAYLIDYLNKIKEHETGNESD